ncbi:MAG: Hpt domain-containing protein [Lachnospiraceae bacterium]|nr:Hpt domain-containing protein [Lachnospiraceae bacterium]
MMAGNRFPTRITLNEGLENCGGSAELYQRVITSFIEEGRKKLPLIKQLYKKEDWKNYIVAVHGLKSSAASIGAMELSAHAKEMEFAGKDEAIGLIHEKTDSLLHEYIEMLQMLTAFCKDKTEEEQIKFFEEYGE